jgi:hypothetical protein
MHSADVLSVEVFAVEDAAIVGYSRGWGASMCMKRLSLTAVVQCAVPVVQAQMLGQDMPLPFILGPEGRGAASVMKDACESSTMRGSDVSLEGSCVLEIFVAHLAVSQLLVTREDPLWSGQGV